VADGGPAGDPDVEPEPMREVNFATLSREDLKLQMVEPYTPTAAPDDYRCFLLPWPYEDTRYITGFGITPGNVQVVHHVAAFLIPPDRVAQYQAWDDADPEPGYSCFGGPSGPGALPEVNLAGMILHAWSPGGPGTDFPEGTGMKVEPGSYIALQVHYNILFNDPEPDQSTVVFKVDEEVEHEAFVQLWADPNWYLGLNMDIPAGDSDVTHTYEVDPWNFPPPLQVFWPHKLVRIYKVATHMHLLGTHATAYIDRPDGTRDCLLDRPQYDFNWQRFYTLKDYVELRPGDRLGVECHFDNSAENQPLLDGVPMEPTDVNWGEESTQEMCMGFFYVVTLDE
ncbi:MAG: monooxygenase, partial [Myxococcota bacterium]|nr:monooxygenase [Myxococcota bacterium]